MFIQNLNKEQQSAFLFLAQELINSDGKLESQELIIMDTIIQQTGGGVQPKALQLHELPIVFDSNLSKNSALLELISIAYSDGQYHDDEKKLISEYTKALNIKDEQLLQLENWVKKQLSLIKDANEFFK
ncbi:TerB family tellurite resistance protein [Pasteurella multocida]|uniref:TerB family tellurite resistance protein n=1 Tax=Pasteurella multocida TaxID=747 RepID=UPI00330A9B76|nr:hypothetical protein [Pasteurella multocida]